MKGLFKNSIKSYLIVSTLGIIVGLSVVFFSLFPHDDLWGFAYWSSTTLGFWMFSTSLIVLYSEKVQIATINAGIYVFILFFITGVSKSSRHFNSIYSTFGSWQELFADKIWEWLLYGIFPAICCAALGFVLWFGRKNTIIGKMLCIMPAVFILIEDILLFQSVFTMHTKLFSAIVDLICLMLYVFALKKHIFSKRTLSIK